MIGRAFIFTPWNNSVRAPVLVVRSIEFPVKHIMDPGYVSRLPVSGMKIFLLRAGIATNCNDTSFCHAKRCRTRLCSSLVPSQCHEKRNKAF